VRDRFNSVPQILPSRLPTPSMPPTPEPKAILFDLGGVCVPSPFQAILDFERSQNIPVGWVNHAIQGKTPNGSWHCIERGDVPLDEDWFAWFKRDLEDPALWKGFHVKMNGGERPALPVPNIDAECLFWKMMEAVRGPDEYMLSALQKLKASGRFIVAALSNTVIFPEGHPYNTPTSAGADLLSQFDVFISSAHVGMRKPDPKIYELAVQELDKFDQARGGNGLKPGEIVFLDDIGDNLKTARSLGLRTIRVRLGKIKDAVKELEAVTGVSLAEGEERAKL